MNLIYVTYEKQMPILEELKPYIEDSSRARIKQIVWAFENKGLESTIKEITKFKGKEIKLTPKPLKTLIEKLESMRPKRNINKALERLINLFKTIQTSSKKYIYSYFYIEEETK